MVQIATAEELRSGAISDRCTAPFSQVMGSRAALLSGSTWHGAETPDSADRDSTGRRADTTVETTPAAPCVSASWK